MTLITRFGAILVLIAAAMPLVAGTTIDARKEKGCKKHEFWFEDKKCCLPHGGPHSPPPPPPKKSCPPWWSWDSKYDCCLPHYPPPPPPPQCKSGWNWSVEKWCCEPHNQPPPPPPKPSHRPKRSLDKSRSVQLCPSGLRACPIPGVIGLTGDYECLDTTAELESCGGCASIGEGQDCTAIKGAWNVGCEHGHCAVYTCAGGFRRSHDGKSCIEL